MPVIFNLRLIGPPEPLGWSQNVGKLAGIQLELNAKPIFGAALVLTGLCDAVLNYDISRAPAPGTRRIRTERIDSLFPGWML